MAVEDFGLEPSFEKIGKLVAFFFGDNRRYYDQLPSAECKIGNDQFEVRLSGS